MKQNIYCLRYHKHYNQFLYKGMNLITLCYLWEYLPKKKKFDCCLNNSTNAWLKTEKITLKTIAYYI